MAEQVEVTYFGDQSSSKVLICLPGTLISPLVFTKPRFPRALGVMCVSWMTGQGPWDLRSIGRRISTLARTLTQRSVYLAGHSTGGAIALAAAIQDSDVFSGIILSNTGANMGNHGDVQVILEGVKNQWGPRVWEPVIQRSFWTQPDEELRITLKDYASTVSQLATLEVLSSQWETDFTEDLGRINIPVVIAHGRHDHVRPLSHAEFLYANIPNAELKLLEAGHTPMSEDPVGYVQAVIRLLDM